MLTRSRKLVFSALTIVLLLGSVEVGARVYGLVRFHNSRALSHGLAFLHAAAAGRAELPSKTNLAALHRATDDLFAHRSSSEAVQKSGEAHTFVRPGGGVAHINSLGLRGPEISSDPARGNRRIATFGGSYVFGLLLSDEEAWPTVLGTLLRQRGLPLEVVNAGHNGDNIHHVLQAAIYLTSRAKVDYFLVTSAYNNQWMVPLEHRVRATVARRLDQYLYNLSYFHVMLTERLARGRGEPLAFSLYREETSVDPAAIDGWIEMYRTRLGQLATVARERGAILVMASQAELFYDARLNALSVLDAGAVGAIGQRIARHEIIWMQELEYYLQGRMNLEARRFASETPGVLFFDGSTVLEADKEKYFLDVIHPSPAGAETLAAALARFFADTVGAAADGPR